MLLAKTQKNIENLLIEKNLVTADKLRQLKADAVREDKPLLQLIQDSQIVDEETATKLLAQVNNIPYVNLGNVVVAPEVLSKLTREVADSYKAVPFGRTDGRLAVAMLDPSNVQAVDFLTRKTGESIITYLASRGSIDNVLLQYSAEIDDDIKQAIATVADEGKTKGG